MFTLTFFEVIDLDVRVRVELFFDANGTPITTLRVLSTAGDNSGGLQNQLSFGPTSPATVLDNVKVPCTEPVGNDVFYKLTNNSYTAQTDFGATVSVLLVLDLPTPPFPDVEFNLWTSPVIELLEIPDLQMKAPDIVENLGELKPDNRPPVVGGISAPNGDEGSQIQFHVDATDNCGPPSVRWEFSDGGVAFGTDPKHTFNDDGHYTGQVIAKDDTGNTTTKNFALDVANLKPVVKAGPDDTEDWGRPVQLTVRRPTRDPATSRRSITSGTSATARRVRPAGRTWCIRTLRPAPTPRR